MAALVVYEYIITLRQEITMIWQWKWTLVTWLFMANRYLLIGVTLWSASPSTSSKWVINCPSILAAKCNFSGTSCAPGQVMGELLLILQNGVFAALRVFALSDRNIPMTLLVLALNVVPVALYIFTFSHATNVLIVDPIFGTFCTAIINFSASVNFDILLVMNIAQVVVDNVPSLENYDFVTIVISTWPILISRFLLNLRQVGSPEIDSQEAFNSQFSVPGFRIPSLASIIGNMGEDLDYGGLAEEVEDEAENTSESIQAEEGAVPETIIEVHPSSMNPTPSAGQLIHIV
ncbi:hypothetical protein EW026_g2176 [Hermanssonia centrifuga]|uniref:DUF6533 domain-containing protein n=1 Tax=Hermanssonia centrifuga TaxID=98765 RepID=A0A4S4KTQ3_9APHY|nr:hypothetical protein EW026_g2176 [Hermanssonia centrifuga]